MNTNEKNKISFILKCKNANNNDLKMKIYILKMGIFRIKIDDILPKEGSPEETKKRFRVKFCFNIILFCKDSNLELI